MRDAACDTGAIIADAVAPAVEWRATDQAALDREEAALVELTMEVSPGSVPFAHPLVAGVLRARRAVRLPAEILD
jgi:hypothetical protein